MWGTGRFYLQKEMGQSQHSPSRTAPPCGNERTHQHVPVPSRALPTAGWGNAASPRGADTLRATCAVSPSSKPCFSPSHPKSTLEQSRGVPVPTIPLTLKGLRWSVVDLQVVHQLLHAGEGQLAAVAGAGVVLPWKEKTALALVIAPSSPVASPPPYSAHLRPVCASAAAGPAWGLLHSPLLAWGRQAEPLRCSLWGRGCQAADTSALCSRHTPMTLGLQPQALELGGIQVFCSCVVGPRFLFAKGPVPVSSFLLCTNGYLTRLGQFGALGGGGVCLPGAWFHTGDTFSECALLDAAFLDPPTGGPLEGSMGRWHPHGGHQQPL